ncbi:flagellar basal-body rod protein FlgC [Armatimonadetes bacterium GBS]|jgi:flagellar basal-body rod protein FlgC|nr:Flagellar basal-body rod protein FlgC [bacterium HR14]GIV13889.1 MAG: flagellar basal-body rod protein FlgC [Fimbriimonadales bacterium]CUU00600.1 flagellar basal-body rod protein FlgC [Armatimonadetes bacterium GBS]CUU34843.1 flagellar basal-body rod protein FlgC [Armatimonadetes bacterium GXS]
MGLINTMRVSASGLSAERLRMDLIADNLANANSTRTPEGGPYRRKVAIFEPITPTASMPGGVRVVGIAHDPTPPRLVYQPGHPDADPNGYVAYPNVEMVHEMVDLITASRAYEANIQAFNAAKNMVLRTLDIGRV